VNQKTTINFGLGKYKCVLSLG